MMKMVKAELSLSNTVNERERRRERERERGRERKKEKEVCKREDCSKDDDLKKSHEKCV